jgi:hypothetical protein
METIPLYIQWYAEKIGKEISAFTAEDWRDAAFSAAEFIGSELPKPIGRPGRPRKHLARTRQSVPAMLVKNYLLAFEYRYEQPKRQGRPRQLYYGFPVEWYAKLLDEIGRCSNAPRTETKRLEFVLKTARKMVGGYVDQSAVARALRRYK